ADGGLPTGHQEFTTVTGRVRRVGHFDPELVRRALGANEPNRIVLNHLDYVDWQVRSGALTEKARSFVERVEGQIDRQIDWIGTGPADIRNRHWVEISG